MVPIRSTCLAHAVDFKSIHHNAMKDNLTCSSIFITITIIIIAFDVKSISPNEILWPSGLERFLLNHQVSHRWGFSPGSPVLAHL